MASCRGETKHEFCEMTYKVGGGVMRSTQHILVQVQAVVVMSGVVPLEVEAVKKKR